MKYLVICAEVVCGLTLLALYVTDTVTEVPYSIFAIMLGGGLLADAIQRFRTDRRSKQE